MQEKFLKSCLKGLLTAFIASAVLLFAFSYICYTREDPDAVLKPLGLVALFFSAFLCGFVSARLNKQSGLICGLASGGFFTMALVATSLAVRSGEGSVSLLTWLAFLAVWAVAAIGGYLGVPSPKRRKMRKTGRR